MKDFCKVGLARSIFPAALFLVGLTLAGPALAADLLIASSVTFASLDGSASDDDGVADGCLTVDGTLTIATGGSINANDPAVPIAASAGDICLHVAADMQMDAGSAIFAENRVSGGDGGDITIVVAGTLTLAAVDAPDAGAQISSTSFNSGASGDAGDITIDTGGDVELGIGSSIIANVHRANGAGGDIAITSDASITLRGNVTDGARITATQTAGSCTTGGLGGNVDLTAALDVVAEGGSRIQVNARCNAGTIEVLAGRAALMDGLVESFSQLTGTGAVQRPGGGRITIDAGCTLIVSDTGRISSRGFDPGADLVHLEGGCDVTILGLVESTGVGHGIPNSPPTSLNSTFRPDKPSNSTAGVEVWSGENILIDSTNGHAGEVHADNGGPGGTDGTGWVDIIAAGDITIIGDTVAPFAVHVNALGGNDDGGLLTVLSTGGAIDAVGLALQADCTFAGGFGGRILVEADGDISLDTASLYARGDFNQTGGYGRGGHIGEGAVPGIRSYNGTVSWQNGTGDVRPTGDDNVGVLLPPASRGTIVYQDCTAGSVDTTGTSFPHDGTPNPTTPTELGDVCGGAPVLQSYVELPPCAQCNEDPPGCKWCTKVSVLSQVIQNMEVCCAVPDVLVDLRPFDDSADDNDCLTVDPARVGTDDPATCSIQSAVDYLMANGDPDGDGQLFVGVTASDCGTDIVGSGPCAGQSGRAPYGDGVENVVIENTRPERLNVFGCSVTLEAADPGQPVITIRDSVGKVTVLDVHVTGSTVAGYLVEDNDDLVIVKNARAFGNTVGYQIEDDEVEITGSPEIGENGTGVVAVGDKLIFRSNRVFANLGIGLSVQGNENVVRGGPIEENGSHGVVFTGNDGEVKDLDVYLNNGDGIRVAGDRNTVESNDIGDKNKGNTGAGARVTGNDNTIEGLGIFRNGGGGLLVVGNGNTIDQNDVGNSDLGNTGDGINVAGAGNEILENDLYGNTGDGLEVSGGTALLPNYLQKNRAGDRGTKANGGNGIWVHGDTGTGTSDPNELEENTAKANGLSGIRVDGSAHELKKNVSGGSSAADNNGDCEFLVVAGNFNGKDNKSNNTTVLPNTDGAAFPTGCTGTP